MTSGAPLASPPNVIIGRPRETEAVASLPTRHGELQIHVFRLGDATEVIALVHGEVAGEEPALVRLHSECLTGEALGNFPQAFTHLGLISAAFHLSAALDGPDAEMRRPILA